MAEVTHGRVTEVKVEGPFTGVSKKTGKEYTYNNVKITVNGDIYSKMQFDDVSPVSNGDLVKITFQTNTTKRGTFNNIIDIEESDETHLEESKTTGKSKSSSTKLSTSSSTPMLDRDLSMEVSGVVQALLSTGLYSNHEVGLDTEALMEDAQKALQVKRTIAGLLKG